jgi:hypothetical protein
MMYGRPVSGTRFAREAAISAASAAAGAGIARVAKRVASEVGKRVLNKSAQAAALRAAQAEIVPLSSSNLMHHASAHHLFLSSDYRPVHVREKSKAGWFDDLPPSVQDQLSPASLEKLKKGPRLDKNIHMGTAKAAFDRVVSEGGGGGSIVDRYEIVDPSMVTRRIGKDTLIDNAGQAYRELIAARQSGLPTPSFRPVQDFDYGKTPNNRILSYVNQGEDAGSVAYVVPRTQVKGAASATRNPAVVYRGSAQFPEITSRSVKQGKEYVTTWHLGEKTIERSQIPEILLNMKYTSPQIESAAAELSKRARAINASSRRAAAQAAALGYTAGFVTPRAVNARNGRR